MLEPKQINPLQIPRVGELPRRAIEHRGGEIGHPVDPKCAEVQRLVLEMILENGGAWRAEIEQTARCVLGCAAYFPEKGGPHPGIS